MSGIAIVGPGRLGQAMGKLLSRAGFCVQFVIARRHDAARQAVRFIGSGRPVALPAANDELSKAGVILLTVADAALSRVVQNLASRVLRVAGTTRAVKGPEGCGYDWHGKVVMHTCGSMPSSVLRPLKRQGAAIGSLHPFQTIPSPATGVRNLKACFWGIEGDGRALHVATQWVEALGGITFRVRPAQKTIYHLAAFLVCPTIVTLMDESLRLLERAGVRARIARPMLSQFVTETARNFAELGARRALTGPAARGDWPTIRRHLAVLRRVSPKTIPVYRALLDAMLRLAGNRRVQKSKKQNNL
jgi:predicted short-subunit dehydrogenase-like oxidoreductase (DUF2520 family)